MHRTVSGIVCALAIGLVARIALAGPPPGTVPLSQASVTPLPSGPASSVGDLLERYRITMGRQVAQPDFSTVSSEISGFLNEARAYLQRNPPDASDPQVALLTRAMAKMESLELLAASMVSGGCAKSENYDLKKLTKQVFQGALAADTCRIQAVQLSQQVAQLVALGESTDRLYTRLRDEEDPDLALRKIAFAQEAVRNGRANNERARWYFNYQYRGQEPNCQGDSACAEYMQELKRVVRPHNLQEMATQAEAIYREAQGFYEQRRREWERDGGSARSFTPAEAERLDLTAEYRARMARILDIPGMRTLAYTEAFQKNVTPLMNAHFARKVCSPQRFRAADGSPLRRCGFTRLQPEPKHISLEAINGYVDEVVSGVDRVNQNEIAPLEQKLAEIQNPGNQTGRIYQRMREGQRVRPDEIAQVDVAADGILEKMIKRQPLAFGAALISNPNFAINICRDLAAYSADVKRDSMLQAVTDVGLASAVVASILLPLGPYGLAAGAVITAYETYAYLNRAAGYRDMAASVVQNALLACELGQCRNVDDTQADRRYYARRASHYDVSTGLVAFGFVGPALHGGMALAGAVPSLLALRATQAGMEIERTLESIRVAGNIAHHDAGGLHALLHRVSRLSEAGHGAETAGNRGLTYGQETRNRAREDATAQQLRDHYERLRINLGRLEEQAQRQGLIPNDIPRVPAAPQPRLVPSE